MEHATIHPSEADLLAFNRGELDDTLLTSVGQHLDRCPGCCDQLHQLAERDRSLLWLRRFRVRPDEGTFTAKGNDPANLRPAAKPDEPTVQLVPPAPQRAGHADPPLPAMLGNYEILGEIARGGMGIVYKARHFKLNRFVALKVTRAGRLATAEETQRFQQEAEAAAKLDHRHIVPIYEAGNAQGQHFIAMAFVEGESLARALVAGPLPPRRAADIVNKMALAVAYAHAQGVIHRDLKPANVLLDGAGEPRVTDFGLAKSAEMASELTHTGQILGTPSFMPPEQAEGKIVGPAADVYSLGATLYCTLTGRPPFQAASTLETLKQVVEQPPVPPQQINAAVDRDLDTICMKCLEKRPENRYASATALAEDLARFLDGRPILARRVGGAERFWRWCQRNPMVAGLAAMLFLSLLAGVAGVVWQWRIAVDNEHKAQDLAKLERWERYRSNMAEAGIALHQQDMQSARRALLNAPEEYRGWEWRYFVGQLDGSLRTAQITTSPSNHALGIAVHPTRWRMAIPWPDGAVRWWDPTGELPPGLPRASGPSMPTAVYSPDGKLLAVNADDGAVHVWKDESADRLRVLRADRGTLVALQFSKDGAVLAGHRRDADISEVRLWNTRDGSLLFACPASRTVMLSDGNGLVSADKRQLRYFPNVSAKTPPLILDTPNANVTQMALRPDDRQLACEFYSENKIRVWDLTTGKQTALLSGHKNFVYQLAYSPDGRLLAAASHDLRVYIWDVAAGRLLHRLMGHADAVTSIAFSPNGTQLVSGSADGTGMLWNVETGELNAVLRGHHKGIESVRFSHDGRRIVTVGGDGALRIWDTHLADTSILRGHENFVYDVAFSPDGTQIASAAWDRTLRLWDSATGRPIREMKHDAEYVETLEWHPDGRRILTRSRFHEGKGSNLTIWEAATGQRLRRIPLAAAFYIPMRGVFRPGADQVAAGGFNDTVRFCDVKSGAETATMHGKPSVHDFGVVLDLAFRPDGAQLASGDRDGNVRFWDPHGLTEIAILTAHKGDVLRVRYNQDGKILASASADRTVRLWDPNTRQCLAELPHGGKVYGLAFSPDGARLATACSDKTIRLWSLDNFQEVGVLRGHNDYVHAVDFSPDGRRLVSASGDFTVRIWDSGDAAIGR